MSRVEAYRSDGSFARQRSMIHRRGGGTAGLRTAIGSGSSSMIAESVWAAEGRRNAGRPVTIS